MGSALDLADAWKSQDDCRSTRRRPRNVTRLSNYLPDFTAGDSDSAVAGLRPCSPDGLPYIGRFPRFRAAEG